MSNVVNDFHNFRAVSIYWMYFFEIYIDRNIVYLDQSTLRHQGQNRAFEAGTCKKSRISISF